MLIEKMRSIWDNRWIFFSPPLFWCKFTFEHYPSRLLCSCFSWKIFTFRGASQTTGNEIWLQGTQLVFMAKLDTGRGKGIEVVVMPSRPRPPYLQTGWGARSLANEWSGALSFMTPSRTRKTLNVHMVINLCKICKTLIYFVLKKIFNVYFFF